MVGNMTKPIFIIYKIASSPEINGLFVLPQ